MKLYKKIKCWYLVYSFLFSVMLMLSMHAFHYGNTMYDTYVTDFNWLDLIVILLLTGFLYFVIQGVVFVAKSIAVPLHKNQQNHLPDINKEVKDKSERKVKESEGKEKELEGKEKESERKEKALEGTGKKVNWKAILIFFGITALFMLLWLPYLMSFRPGGIYADTVDSLSMALGQKELDNHNPILYTLIWKFMFEITGAFRDKSPYPGLNLFTVLQTLAIAATMAYFITWLWKKKYHPMLVLTLVGYVGLVSLYPFYGISLWKDTPFSLAVFWYSFFLYRLAIKDKEELSAGELIRLGVLSLLVIFLRNNGLYICIFSSLVILLASIGRKKRLLKLTPVLLIVLVGSILIQGPYYRYKGYNYDSKRESYGIPLQQVAYMVAMEGNVLPEDVEVLSQILPMERWVELYNPTVADSIKFAEDFNLEYFENNSEAFRKTYLNMVKNNKMMAVKAYLLATIGFWNIKEESGVAYICNFHFGNAEYFMSDYFDIPFQRMVEPDHYMSCAIPFWILLFIMAACLQEKKCRQLMALAPTLGVWITIMVATPIGYSFRYIYSLFLCFPLYFLILEGLFVPKESID